MKNNDLHLPLTSLKLIVKIPLAAALNLPNLLSNGILVSFVAIGHHFQDFQQNYFRLPSEHLGQKRVSRIEMAHFSITCWLTITLGAVTGCLRERYF